MSGTIGTAIGLDLLGGFHEGGFAFLLMNMPRWCWENTGLVYSTARMHILPWMMVFLMIPHQGWAIDAGPPLQGMENRCF